jgi:hypothetical protein
MSTPVETNQDVVLRGSPISPDQDFSWWSAGASYVPITIRGDPPTGVAHRYFRSSRVRGCTKGLNRQGFILSNTQETVGSFPAGGSIAEGPPTIALLNPGHGRRHQLRNVVEAPKCRRLTAQSGLLPSLCKCNACCNLLSAELRVAFALRFAKSLLRTALHYADWIRRRQIGNTD